MFEALDDTESSVHRIAQIVSDLRIFSRPASQPEGGADVVRCIEWAVRTTAHEFRQRAELITDLAVVPPVTADETRLGQVFINLLMNAAQAIPPGRADRNQVRIATRDTGAGRVSVEIRDTGDGISKENLRRIFEPFYTTKPVGVGTGLGLSICHGIVRSMGGEIEVESEIGRGTVVRLSLPVAMRLPAGSAEIVVNDRPRLHGRILIVEDEGLVRRAMQRILDHHEVHCVDNAADALTLIRQGRTFDVILCDVMMPTMTGVEFYEQVLRMNPALARQIVFVSGGATTAEAEDFVRTVPNLHLMKPFKPATLEEAVQRSLALVRRPQAGDSSDRP
jgi:two-component system cell cycle sensor histidine kinase/response regulator CckA